MAHRSSRYRPEHDDPYISKQAYPDSDPYAGVNDDAYDYVGPNDVPEPPQQTFDDEPSSSRRRNSPSRKHRSTRERASTLPPKYAEKQSPPPRSRRDESPPVRSSRHSTSPPRPRRSRRHDGSPSRGEPVVAAAAPRAGVKDKYGRWLERPAVKNMKTYGSKGLKTVGNIVEAYAAAQAGGAVADGARPGGRARGGYDDYYDDPYDRPPRRSRRAYTPSPSPSPPRRGEGRRSDRHRPTNSRQKSYSLSPAPRSKGYDSDDDRPRRRRSRRHSPSPSPSPSPRRRRARSFSQGRDSVARSSKNRSKSKSDHPHMDHYRNEFKSPSEDVAHRWQLAARAALEAGGVTAFRLRKEPGSWTGQKGAKVVTAALGAAAIDSFIDKDPRRNKGGGMKGMAESVVGGLVASKLMGFKSGTTHKGKARYL